MGRRNIAQVADQALSTNLTYLSMPIFGVSGLNFNKFHYYTFITHQNCVNAKYEIIPKGVADFYHICI